MKTKTFLATLVAVATIFAVAMGHQDAPPAFALTPQTSSFATSNVAVCSPVPTSNVLIQFAVSSNILPSGNIVFHIADKITVTNQAGHVIGTGHELVDTIVHEGSWNTNQDNFVGTCSGSGLQFSVHLIYTIDSNGNLTIRN